MHFFGKLCKISLQASSYRTSTDHTHTQTQPTNQNTDLQLLPTLCYLPTRDGALGHVDVCEVSLPTSQSQDQPRSARTAL